MSKKLFLLTFFLQILSASNSITDLTAENWENYINSHKFVFLKIYSKKCMHCKVAKKPFIETSEKFSNLGINFADLDGDVHVSTLSQLDVKGFPAIFLFVNGVSNRLQYFGAVSEKKHFEEFLEEILSKQSLPTFNETIINELQKHDNYTGFGLFCGTIDTKISELLINSIILIHNYQVFQTNEQSICQKFLISNDQFAFMRVSKNIATIKNIDQIKNLKNSLQFLKFDFLNPFTQEFVMDSIGDSIPLLIYADKEYDSKKIKELEKFYVNFPKNKIIALHNKFKSEFEKDYFPIFGIENDELPVLLIAEIKSEMVKYKYSGDWTVSSIADFVNKYFLKKIPRHLKSQKDVPKNKLIENLTSNKIYDFIADQKKNKLLLFYTLNCSGCPELLKTFVQIAERFKSDERIKFGQIDTSQNEVPDIKKIPALTMFGTVFEKNPAFFKGEGDFDKIMDFITQNLENKVETDL